MMEQLKEQSVIQHGIVLWSCTRAVVWFVALGFTLADVSRTPDGFLLGVAAPLLEEAYEREPVGKKRISGIYCETRR